MSVLLEVKGYTGQLVITEKKIIIKAKGLGGFLAKGPLAGDKEIPIKSITAVDYRKAGMLANGHLQFSIQGEMGHKGGGFSNTSDENTVIFTKKQGDDFMKAKELIEELMEKVDHSQGTTVNQLSPADELKKFGDLRDQGLITEDEFNAKKKEILGL